MRTSSLGIWTAILLGAITGCSKTDDAAATASKPTKSAGQDAAKAPAADSAGPVEAVATFLEAVKNGQDAKANGMLTKLALQETAKMNMVVAPPGSETASFEVGEVELLSEGDEVGAQVASKWTDLGDDGLPHTDEIIWMLRKEPEGWRIAGMATTVFPGEPPLLLDFENPQDMQRKQQLAEEEMQRRMRAELSSADSNSADSNSAESSGGETNAAERGAASVADDSAAAADEQPSRQAQRPAAKKAARK